MSDKLAVGDRVTIKDPARLVQPFREWGEQGRKGTVTAITERGQAVVMMDCKRRPKWPGDYEILANQDAFVKEGGS